MSSLAGGDDDTAMPQLEPMESWHQQRQDQGDPDQDQNENSNINTAAMIDLADDSDLDEDGDGGGDGGSEAARTPKGEVTTKTEPGAASSSSAINSKMKKAINRKFQIPLSFEIDLTVSSEEDDSDADHDTDSPHARRKRQQQQQQNARAGVDYPSLESFTLNLSQSRVFSGRALRRDAYPLCYPASPKPRGEEEEKSSIAADGSNTPTTTQASTSKKPAAKKRRRAVPDYYDCSDAFIDDSELIDDSDMLEDSHAQQQEDEDGVVHSMTPAQLTALYQTFTVSGAFTPEAIAAIDAQQQHQQNQQTKKKKPNAATSATTATTDGKSNKKSTTGTAASTTATTTTKKKKPTSVDSSKDSTKESSGDSAAPVSAAKRKRTKGGDDAAAAAVASLPPLDSGSLDKDWLPCFEKFRSQQVVILCEEIVEEYKTFQNATTVNTTATTTPAAPTATATTPTAATTSIANTTTDATSAAPSTTTPTAAAAATPSRSETPMDIDSSTSAAVDLTTEPNEEGEDQFGRNSATPEISRPRNLRAKSSASIVAHRAIQKMPDSLARLLARLGALLETQSADDFTVNRFISVLTFKLCWSRKLIKDRLTTGRLEGQLSSYLKERYTMYLALKEEVYDDITTQQAALNAGNTTTTTLESLRQSYQPTWSRYMSKLIDYASVTDDISDALEEMESFIPKKVRQDVLIGSVVVAPATQPQAANPAAAGADSTPTPAGSSTPAPVDPSQRTILESSAFHLSLLQSLWSSLNIGVRENGETEYPQEHLPLLLSTTNTLYANLPLLWIWPAPQPTSAASAMSDDAPSATSSAARITLVTEEHVERSIDAAEQAERDQIIRAEEAAAAAIEAEAAAERRRIEEVQERKEREEREAAEELKRSSLQILAAEQERQAAKVAAAQAKAAAAASSSSAPSPKPKKTAASSGTTAGASSSAEGSSTSKKPRARSKPTDPPRAATYARLPPESERWNIIWTMPTSPVAAPATPPQQQSRRTVPAAAASSATAPPPLVHAPSDSTVSNLSTTPSHSTPPPLIPLLPPIAPNVLAAAASTTSNSLQNWTG